MEEISAAAIVVAVVASATEVVDVEVVSCMMMLYCCPMQQPLASLIAPALAASQCSVSSA